MAVRIKSIVGILAAVTIALVASAAAQTPSSDTVRIGYQKSSTLTAILKNNGVLEKALAPLWVRGHFRRQELDGRFAFQPRVVGQKNLPHAAGAKLGRDTIVADRLANDHVVFSRNARVND